MQGLCCPDVDSSLIITLIIDYLDWNRNLLLTNPICHESFNSACQFYSIWQR
jgi:hypothetical protein